MWTALASTALTILLQTYALKRVSAAKVETVSGEDDLESSERRRAVSWLFRTGSIGQIGERLGTRETEFRVDSETQTAA